MLLLELHLKYKTESAPKIYIGIYTKFFCEKSTGSTVWIWVTTFQFTG